MRELSASRMPGEQELAEIADRLRRAVAAALDLAHPDPEAVSRRTLVAPALQKAGAGDLGWGDPMRWIAEPR